MAVDGKPAALYILLNSLKLEHGVDDLIAAEFDDEYSDDAGEGLRGPQLHAAIQ